MWEGPLSEDSAAHWLWAWVLVGKQNEQAMGGKSAPSLHDQISSGFHVPVLTFLSDGLQSVRLNKSYLPKVAFSYGVFPQQYKY